MRGRAPWRAPCIGRQYSHTGSGISPARREHFMRSGVLVLCISLCGGLAVSAAEKGGKPTVEKKDFGKTAEGTPVALYVLTNGKGMTVKITNYGGIVTELHVPDRDGKLADVVLGFDNL